MRLDWKTVAGGDVTQGGKKNREVRKKFLKKVHKRKGDVKSNKDHPEK